MLDMVEEFSKRGNQLFVTLKKGKEYPPTCCDVRVQYEQTIMDLRKKVEEATGVPTDKQLLFHHFKELTEEDNDKTILEKNLHTGFSLTGYDLVSALRSWITHASKGRLTDGFLLRFQTESPHYWPPVTKTPEGLVLVTKSTFPNEVSCLGLGLLTPPPPPFSC